MFKLYIIIIFKMFKLYNIILVSLWPANAVNEHLLLRNYLLERFQ